MNAHEDAGPPSDSHLRHLDPSAIRRPTENGGLFEDAASLQATDEDR